MTMIIIMIIFIIMIIIMMILIIFSSPYKVPPRDGVDFIPRGRRKPKRVNAVGVPLVCTWCALLLFLLCCMSVPVIRSDDVCLIFALDTLLLWFDLLLCTNPTHTVPGTKARS